MAVKKAKRYYWLKLKEDFFEDDTIEWIEEQEGGKDYCLFYLKLCLKSLKNDGVLIRTVGENLIPYDVKALSKLTNTDPDTVRVALEIFQKIGLIKRLDTGEIYMQQIDEMIGSETEKAELMRKKRARESLKSGDCSEVVTMLPNCYQNVTQSKSKSLEKDLELDKEKDLDIEKENVGNVSPTPPPTSKPKKKKEILYGEDNPYYLMALFLREEILKANPRAKPPKPKVESMQTWADHIRKLIELDKVDYNEVEDVIRYIFNEDDFWYMQIQSAKKLRDKYPQIYPLYEKSRGGGRRKNQLRSTLEDLVGGDIYEGN